MKIHPSALVSELSGTIGKLTVQRSRAGLAARHTPSAIGRVTSFRRQRRMLFAAAVQRWQQLAPETRQTWATHLADATGYGIRGPLKPSSGYTYFVAQYSLDTICSGSAWDTPPPYGTPESLRDVEVTATFNPHTFILSWTPVNLEANQILIFSACTFASIASAVGGNRWLAVVPLGGGLSSPYNIGAGDAPSWCGIGRAVGVRLSLYDATLRRLARPAVARTVVAP